MRSANGRMRRNSRSFLLGMIFDRILLNIVCTPSLAIKPSGDSPPQGLHMPEQPSFAQALSVHGSQYVTSGLARTNTFMGVDASVGDQRDNKRRATGPRLEALFRGWHSEGNGKAAGR